MSVTEMSTTVFSEFEVAQMVAIFGGGTITATCDIECVGKLEVEHDVRTVVKNCRGIAAKKVVRGLGTGTLKLTAHMPRACYDRMHGMVSANADGTALKTGITGYGYGSTHEELCLTADVFDEDGNEEYRAWPVCVVNAGPATTVENGAEEVVETELEIAFSPDSNGIGQYRSGSTLATADATKWMHEFTPAFALVSGTL